VRAGDGGQQLLHAAPKRNRPAQMGFTGFLLGSIKAHRDHSAEYLDETAIPVFDDIVMSSEPRIYSRESLPIHSIPQPRGDTGRPREAVESLPKGFVINFL
jgi:hypothetical protein